MKLSKSISVIFFILFVFSPLTTFARSKMDWLEFKEYEQCGVTEFNILKPYITLKKSELTTIEPSAVYAKFDLNKDGIIDYFVSIASNTYCGTAGCTTFLLLSHDNSYIKINLPHTYAFSSNKAIGVNESNGIIVAGRNGIGIWKLYDNKIILIKTQTE